MFAAFVGVCTNGAYSERCLALFFMLGRSLSRLSEDAKGDAENECDSSSNKGRARDPLKQQQNQTPIQPPQFEVVPLLSLLCGLAANSNMKTCEVGGGGEGVFAKGYEISERVARKAVDMLGGEDDYYDEGDDDDEDEVSARYFSRFDRSLASARSLSLTQPRTHSLAVFHTINS